MTIRKQLIRRAAGEDYLAKHPEVVALEAEYGAIEHVYPKSNLVAFAKPDVPLTGDDLAKWLSMYDSVIKRQFSEQCADLLANPAVDRVFEYNADSGLVTVWTDDLSVVHGGRMPGKIFFTTALHGTLRTEYDVLAKKVVRQEIFPDTALFTFAGTKL